jgi:excinuclease ABC subunit B
MSTFKLKSDYKPAGDQPKAIDALIREFHKGQREQILLGVTGSGKTFTVANVIASLNLPVLVIAHNKTLAAQLYGEFKDFFPDSAVEYFVSFYDYYQPEAYIPSTDTYIDKDSLINDDIDKMRHSATMSVLERKDTIIVSSVSCIYGIGAPQDYIDMHLILELNQLLSRDELLKRLVEILYDRGNEFKRGTFRVRGDTVEVYPSFSDDSAIRIEFFGDYIDGLFEFDPLTGHTRRTLNRAVLYPNSHWITPRRNIERAISVIKEELKEQVKFFVRQNKALEARRIEERTLFDLEMLQEIGFCHGIENYSRHLSGRKQGEPPYCLLNYFPDDFLIVIDESHVTVPQIRGMYAGDRSRKQTLVDFGFRLPSALDNRPLMFSEFETRIKKVMYVSATPGDYEMKKTAGKVVEQIVRPTGLMDPRIEIRPVRSQVDDLASETAKHVAKGHRILATTLTKKIAEDLADFYRELGIKAQYLHSDIDTLERIEILRQLRQGDFDVLIGVNLLREGLDLPEVSLVAILDADKEGFLRSERSLIQTAGRAARNLDGLVIFYADTITGSMKAAIQTTERRRAIQEAYNKANNITPETIRKDIKNILSSLYESDYTSIHLKVTEEVLTYSDDDLKTLEQQMRKAASKLDFEKAAKIRDKVRAIRKARLELGVKV